MYGAIDDQGASATVGVQKDVSNFTQYECNTGGSDQRVDAHIHPGNMRHTTTYQHTRHTFTHTYPGPGLSYTYLPGGRWRTTRTLVIGGEWCH